MKQSLLLFLCLITLSTAAEKDASFTIMAAGGSLKTCTSLSPNNCKNPVQSVEPQPFKTTELYQITPSSINKIVQSSQWRSLTGREVTDLGQLLQNFGRENSEPLSRREFTNQLRDFSISLADSGIQVTGEHYYRSMTDYDWFMLLDYFQIPQVLDGARLEEKVFLADSKDDATELIFKTFVGMAQSVSDNKEKPIVLIMTSSARDPYDAVDFYLQVFKQAGANAKWLPLEQAILQAIDNKDCQNISAYREKITGSVRRSVVYPDLKQIQQTYCEAPEDLMKLIDTADGIFINGGDQSLTRATLIPDNDSPFMAAIRAKVADGKMVVGGTSAGAAVQSGSNLDGNVIPMISSGQSYRALTHGAFAAAPPHEGCSKNASCNNIPENALTYQRDGGLALINTGLVDTHFSERGRQIRLMKLAAHTNTAIAVGVDETTSVIIGEAAAALTYQVVGKNGAWFFVNSAETIQDSSYTLNSTAHYLTHDDTLVFQKHNGQVDIEFAGNRVPAKRDIEIELPPDILYRDSMRQLSNQLALGQLSEVTLYTKETHPQFKITLRKSQTFKELNKAPDTPISKQPVSFSGLDVLVVPCSESCD